MRFHGMLPVIVLAFPASAWAGMPSFELRDIYRMRFEEISFFIFLTLLCALVFKVLWGVARLASPGRCCSDGTTF